MGKVIATTRKSGKVVHKVKIWSPVDQKNVWFGEAYDDPFDAEIALRNAQSLVKDGQSLVAAQKRQKVAAPTVGDACDRWYTYCETTQQGNERKRQNTLRDYKTNKKHLKHYLGENTLLTDVDRDMLNLMVGRFRHGEKFPKELDLMVHGERSTRKLTIRFKQVLHHAMSLGWDVNPEALAYKPYKVDDVSSDYVPLPVSWFKEMLERFDPQFRVMLLIAAGAGLRRGEILALRPIDCEWNGGEPRIQVKRALVYGKPQPLKTKRARRSVSISRELHQHISAYIDFERRGIDRHSDYIFVTPLKKHPWIDTYFSRAFGEQVQRIAGKFPQVALECERVGIHRARHLFASIALEKGMSVLHLSQALGHQSPALTLSVYAHLMKDTDPQLTESIGAEVMSYMPQPKKRGVKPK